MEADRREVYGEDVERWDVVAGLVVVCGPGLSVLVDDPRVPREGDDRCYEADCAEHNGGGFLNAPDLGDAVLGVGVDGPFCLRYPGGDEGDGGDEAQG